MCFVLSLRQSDVRKCGALDMHRGDADFQGCQADESHSLHANRQTGMRFHQVHQVFTVVGWRLPSLEAAVTYMLTGHVSEQYNYLPPTSMYLFLPSDLLSKHFTAHQLLILSGEKQNPTAFLVLKTSSSHYKPF